MPNKERRLDVEEMRRHADSGVRVGDIAKMMGCTASNVSQRLSEFNRWDGSLPDLDMNIIRALTKMARAVNKSPKQFVREVLTREIIRMSNLKDDQ